MLYLRSFTLLTLKILLFESIIAFPDKYEVQDADTKEKFDLLDLLKSVKNDPLENWTGRWLPSRPGEYTPPPKVSHSEDHSHNGNVPMGVKSVCDDGKTNLKVDWDGSSTSYTCFGKKIFPNSSTDPDYYCDTIPKKYKAMHKCMTGVIKYMEDVPTLYDRDVFTYNVHIHFDDFNFIFSGTHRPIWPVYGEYKYVPTQRWLHSLEHGAVVMLYHPCTSTLEVEKLKKLVKGCLRRHIISPNNLLDEERPLALLTWGCKLTMSHVNQTTVIHFIKDNALHGPEKIPFDGDFDDQLIKKSDTVSDESDSALCSKPM